MRNLLDDLFTKEEQEVETFVDVLKRENLVIDPETTSRLVSDRPNAVKAPEFSDQQVGLIRINHGWHDEDYCWHISPAAVKRPWKVSTDRVIYAVAKLLNEVIPNHITVRIWKPYLEWEIPEVTFKAFGLRSVWSITDKSLQDLNDRLFIFLNNLV
jgi:hypothetical protein